MTKEKKVKFSISISPECHEVLSNFVKATGSTKSAFIGEVLEEQMCTLKKLTEEVLKARKDAGKKALNEGDLLDT